MVNFWNLRRSITPTLATHAPNSSSLPEGAAFGGQSVAARVLVLHHTLENFWGLRYKNPQWIYQNGYS